VDRQACVDLPALPLQVLLNRRPDWAEHPAAVVLRDRPQAPLTWINERARDRGILPGMRYAAALSLDGELRADVVPDHEVEAAVAELTAVLQRFSPEVESSGEEPGIFWLNADGLSALYASMGTWIEEMRSELETLGYDSAIAVGFSRFGSYAMAKDPEAPTVLEDRPQETRLARGVPLARLAIDPRFRDALAKLGVDTVGGLVDLPAAGIGERFGPDALRLHRMAAGDLWTPLQPRPILEPITCRSLLCEPILDTTQLLFHVKALLHPLLREVRHRDEVLTRLDLRFVLERGEDHNDEIAPAEPTLDDNELMLLTRLRMESLEIPSGVLEVHLTAASVPASQAQEHLLGEQVKRDLRAGDRALGFLRAEFGPEAVVRPRLRDGHLPEASYTWEPIKKVSLPSPTPRPRPPLVRRLFTRPRTFPQPSIRDPRGWMLHALGKGTVVQWDGPHVIQGGWWIRELHREYWFATTKEGERLWLYHDRRRRRWVVQGRVE
jgi:protein ImuB